MSRRGRPGGVRGAGAQRTVGVVNHAADDSGPQPSGEQSRGRGRRLVPVSRSASSGRNTTFRSG